MTKNLRIGGVMRCCIETLRLADGIDEKDGAVLPCKYCRSALIFRNGAWEWHEDYEAPNGDENKG